MGVWVWVLACGGPSESFEAALRIDEGRVLAALPRDADLPLGPVPAASGAAWLTVQVAGGSTTQAVAGGYSRDGDTLVFTPRFQVAPGTSWEVAWHPPDGHGSTFVLEAAPPAPPGVPPRLERLEPGVDEVPENLLKLTLTFSEPMRGGLTLTDHVHLIDEETGTLDPRAWYRTELWGPERKRLTMLFHPGRIKTGVSFNETAGPVLLAGRSYRVEVTTGLVDLDGEPLVEGATWRFTATAADHTRPVPEDWQLVPPPGPRLPLQLLFDEPMDTWLLETAFVVEDALGTVPGHLAPHEDGTGVAFTPSRPWTPGAYQLRQVGRVEDRAGNTPGRIFDGPPETVKREGPIMDTWSFTLGSE